jgi:hypothetical protein
MLSSIHPLGERVRHNRWAVTVSAFTLAATSGGAAVGAFAGAAGVLLRPVSSLVVATLALLATVTALVAELRPSRVRLPHWRRQVNEDWLDEYRGWVYGAGFGAQLGAGFLTIVTTSAVHLTFVFALLTRSPGLGGVIGGVFGLVRGLSLLVAAPTRNTDDLRLLHRRLDEGRPAAARLVLAGLVAVSVACSVALLGRVSA